jgi:hypothetical protein
VAMVALVLFVVACVVAHRRDREALRRREWEREGRPYRVVPKPYDWEHESGRWD